MGKFIKEIEMSNERAIVGLYSLDSKLPPGFVLSLSNVDHKVADMILGIPLKDPLVGLLLSLFLGWLGVDRFYRGHLGLGLLKLFLSFFAIGFIWIVVDWFLVMGGIRKDNAKKITNFLRNNLGSENFDLFAGVEASEKHQSKLGQ